MMKSTSLHLALASLLLLLAQQADAQPTRRDTMLRPQKGSAALTTAVGGKKASGSAKTKPSSASGKLTSGGGKSSSEDPFAKLNKRTDIGFKPLSPYQRTNFNLDDASLPDLVKAISNITGRRFIFGGKLRADIKATVVSPQKVTVAEAYGAFLSILETNGLTVIPHGRYLKIVQSNGVASKTTPILGTATPVPYEDRFITRMYRLAHASAQDVSTVLGKFKSKEGDITIYQPTNMLILTDTGSNIRRMLRIIEELDSGGVGEQIWLHPIHYAAANDIATKLTEMLDLGSGQSRTKILAEERNNLLVIVATESDYLRVLEIVKRIDVSAAGQGGIHVLPLQHARCDELSQTLSQILGGSSGRSAASGARNRNRNRSRNNRSSRNTRRTGSSSAGSANTDAVFDGEVGVTCDEATNSLVTTSSLRDYARLRAVIDKLDRPRRQVFIEAVIMDVNIDHNRDMGLGLHGGTTADLGGGSQTLFFGGSNPQTSLTGIPSNLEALAFGVRGPELDGTDQLGLGIPGLSIPAFGVTLHAMAKSGDSNVLATPHLLATDNITAQIEIGQNIPLQTNVGGGLQNLAGLAGAAGGAAGALGGLGGLLGGGGFSAPRTDVGIKLKITPHINDSDQVRMELTEEFSDAGSPTGALGVVPINKRTADTTVIVRDQQTVVIGGLVREGQVNGETKIPILGDIPVLGALFRQTQKKTQKTNLLLILTPHIVRDQNDLRSIFERKMQERQEFLDRFFVFNESVAWEPLHDYTRANGMLEHVRQTQLKLEERERLNAEMKPDAPKSHEPVKPIELPNLAAGATTSSTGGKTKRRTNRASASKKKRPKFSVPGGIKSRSRRNRVE